MILLNAIPITSLPQKSKMDVSPTPLEPRVNCMLQSGPLPAHQALEVRVNDVLQTGVQGEGQVVFSWQFFKASDEVRIVLLNRGIRMKQWQGCWNERDAILYSGTLPVQVFFAGKPQPMMEAAMPTSSSAAIANLPSWLSEAANGNSGYGGTMVLEREQEARSPAEGGNKDAVVYRSVEQH